MEQLDFVYAGDCLDFMDRLYSEQGACLDLIFADPPYNLAKNYTNYEDTLHDQTYLDWCNSWLERCVKLLKPTGTLFVLNLPKWTTHHAVLLNKHLYFRHWIVWDALSEPRGKIMPAHYSLLYYTASATQFTYNAPDSIYTFDQCLRTKCVTGSKRELAPKTEVSDIWYDVHRIKHKRDRDHHPCQLPEKLMERVISIASNEGDVVFDPFTGTGTTLVVAKRLGRHYLGAELDDSYKAIADAKLADVFAKRSSISKKVGK